ncbi:MAG TPA: ATP-dependent Clp protease proteolytic subunit [Dictyoglomaceae bacterium]|nr:ATP-dependent Clp protease proteolytic subunit [Dictyoglomaceae bacterium]HOL38931.1 ATP-dependent Clp protease proteolytic subunit [Dictyoglomaceae bacterium]HOP94881.1 ATP-dependent Clp protease proteolytic subunit [Dictyoglomaceae bacterium]HPP15652.1 ATP-dependent Clp protease proteolytic subunit [Dictyoglomaceae bacterium]HPU43814.1 ATP-dependent Clp protease proteolytic subunit [Dictyoglomaceae bacterium]
MSLWNIFWIIIIMSAFSPIVRQRIVEAERYRLMQTLEKKRESRVITLIHRQESMNFLGIPFARYINIEDSEEVLRAIRLTPDEMPIDLILHTPGGLVLAAEQISHALKNHKGKITVFVPHYAMSGGTFVALAADEIVMDENAVLGPVDPQLGEYPAASILSAIGKKSIDKLEDRTLILADVAEKALSQVKNSVYELLKDKMSEEKAKEISEVLSSGKWTHDYPITVEEAQNLGLPVKLGLPKEIYSLMSLYPQSPGTRPSVQYIPVPYQPYRGKQNNGK